MSSHRNCRHARPTAALMMVLLLLTATACGSGGGSSAGVTSTSDDTGAVPVTDGLVASFVADEGVETAADGSITSWRNVEGTETLTPISASNAGVLVEGVQGGHGVVRFAENLPFGNPNTALVLPTANADRTIVVVAKWQGGMLGAGWGAVDVENGSFFAGNVNRSCRDGDLLGVANWPLVGELCGGQDPKLIAEDTKVVGRGFVAVTAVVQDGALGLFLGGDEVKSSPYEFATEDGSFWIGPNPTTLMDAEVLGTADVLAVFVYDRALDQSEIGSLTDYLQNEYGLDA